MMCAPVASNGKPLTPRRPLTTTTMAGTLTGANEQRGMWNPISATVGLRPNTPTAVALMPETEYRRSTLVTTLIEHQRLENGACACGWAELGRSYARHVAEAYEEKVHWAALIDGSECAT